ncbi:beta-lactamase-like protein [Scenedesmus sp. NREL 46B-D3]|nr:beta-lactamase-like protein [Scenedesmus sp. NREL 46B-D3]
MGGSKLVFRQLFDKESSTYTYLLADAETKEAMLIDPVLEQVERDLQIIDEMGLRLVQTPNTHCHADHITGSGKIKSLRPGVKSLIGADTGAAADVHLREGDTIKCGAIELRVLSTPGHTSSCSSYYMPPDGPDGVGRVFTGDALLIRGCGRTDLQEGDAKRLYGSVHSRLFTLPDDTLVYPAHDYKEKTHNPRLSKSQSEFEDIMANWA